MAAENNPPDCLCENYETYTSQILSTSVPIIMRTDIVSNLLNNMEYPHQPATLFDCRCPMYHEHCVYTPTFFCKECKTFYCLYCWQYHCIHFLILVAAGTEHEPHYHCSKEKQLNAVLTGCLFKVLSLLHLIQSESLDDNKDKVVGYEAECSGFLSALHTIVDILPHCKRLVMDLLINTEVYRYLSNKYPGHLVWSNIEKYNSKYQHYGFNKISRPSTMQDEMFIRINHRKYFPGTTDQGIYDSLQDLVRKCTWSQHVQAVKTHTGL